MAAEAARPASPDAGARAQSEATWDDLQPVDPWAWRSATASSPWSTRPPGRPAQPHQGVRAKFAQEVGFLPPPVHIRDNLELRPSQYRILLRGAVVGEAEAYPGMWLAINPATRAPAHRHHHHRPGLRPARGVDRGTPAGNGPNGRIYPWLIVRPWWRPIFHT